MNREYPRLPTADSQLPSSIDSILHFNSIQKITIENQLFLGILNTEFSMQEFINALSLGQQLQAGRSFAEEEVKQLAKSILEILIYLHGRLVRQYIRPPAKVIFNIKS